jgi:prepilin-type N-terminal cleavage/methylation domain-containing protein
MVSLKRKQSGFTIVELLIVIIVIGILAALVLVTFTGVQQKARNTERQTDSKATASHLEVYYAKNGSMYPSLTDLNSANYNATGNTFVADQLKGLDPASTCDPKDTGVATPPCDYASSSTATQYGYAPTQDDGSACDNTSGAECTKFTLTYTEEGGSQQTINSLN